MDSQMKDRGNSLKQLGSEDSEQVVAKEGQHSQMRYLPTIPASCAIQESTAGWPMMYYLRGLYQFGHWLQHLTAGAI